MRTNTQPRRSVCSRKTRRSLARRHAAPWGASVPMACPFESHSTDSIGIVRRRYHPPPYSPFHCPGSEAAHDVALHNNEEHGYGHEAERRQGHEGRPVGRVLPNRVEHLEDYGVLLR